MSDASPYIQWLSLLPIVYHLHIKTLIKSSDDGNYLDRQPTVVQYPPQDLSADTIESLRFAKSIKLMHKGDCHSMLCPTTILSIAIWSVHL